LTTRLILALTTALLTAHGEIIDRVAVTVGKQVITESEVIRDVRVAAFLDQKPVDLSGEMKRKAADRLVDQILILQDAAVARMALPSGDEVAQVLAQVKSQYPTEADYRATLARYRITEDELTGHLLAGLRSLRFTDLRFRPEVQLSEDDLHTGYDSLASGWRSKSPERVLPTFEESRGQVLKLLTDQRTMEALDRWLGTVRNDTQILYRDAVFQ
jgi:hypothetical protein